MKKNLFFLLLLAIAAVSCQKDIEQGSVASVVEQLKTDYFNSVTPKPSPNDDIAQRIDAFKARIEPTSNFGLDNAMSVDAAIWGIEAVLNQRFSNASKPFIAQQIDSANFTVPLNATGEINSNDVAAALITAKKALQRQWNGVRENAKHVIVTDIALRSQDATAAIFTITSAIGIEQMLRTLIPPPVPFGVGEGWKDSKDFGNNLQGCALSAGQYGNAADKIAERWTNRWVNSPATYYHTDVVSRTLGRNGSDNFVEISTIAYVNKWIYATSFHVNPTCITDIASGDIRPLNEYLAGVPLFIDALKPVGKTYITLSMEGVRELNGSNNGRCHRATIQYGVAHLINTPSGAGESPCCM